MQYAAGASIGNGLYAERRSKYKYYRVVMCHRTGFEKLWYEEETAMNQEYKTARAESLVTLN